METLLYLLIDKQHTKFKIGLTIDVPGRSNDLAREWGDLDLDASYTVIDSALNISRLEKALHFIFEAWNIKNNSDRAGHSEWFDIDCLEQVKQEISRIGELQGSSRSISKGVIISSDRKSSTYTSSSLARLLFKEYRYRVLSLLILQPNKSYHVREIARLTNTIPGTLHKELRMLSNAGVLIKEYQGNQLIYQANIDCVIFEELVNILNKT